MPTRLSRATNDDGCDPPSARTHPGVSSGPRGFEEKAIMMPDPNEAIRTAAMHGWEAVTLVMLIIAILTSFGYVLKRILDSTDSREKRLAERVSSLEQEIRVELFQTLRESAKAVSEMVRAADNITQAANKMIQWINTLDNELASRPCLMHVIHQGQFIEEVGKMYRKHAKEELDEAKQ